MNLDGVFSVCSGLTSFLFKHFIFSIVLMLLGCVFLIVVVISESFRDKIETYVKAIKKFLWNELIDNNIEDVVSQMTKNDKIKKDIQKSIRNLKKSQKIFPSLQTLYLYPSPEGTRAIIEFAIEIPDHSARKKIICSLCDSIKADEWYS